MEKIRIAKFIANSGIASRRDAEKLIESGVVAINGVVINSPAINISDTDVVTINGKVIKTQNETELYIFNKPLNVMTTAHDPLSRKTIYDVLPSEYKNYVMLVVWIIKPQVCYY